MGETHTERLNVALSGRYRIERQIGEGGMATVYLADDLRHARKVALKVLRPELAAILGGERFLAEIRTTANLQHPHIVPLFDSGEADGLLFYVMPYVEGESLRERLDRDGQLPIEEAVRIARDVAEALEAAHEAGFVHRDIKPANILLSRGRPLVTDFGIALAVNRGGAPRLTETGLSVGTPHYMSPEQALGNRPAGPQSDVYALGCVVYEMLVGDPPHTGSSAQLVLAKMLTELPTPPRQARSTIPPNVDAAVTTALQKLPADRFASAGAFAEALADAGFRAPAAVGGRFPGGSRLAAGLATLAIAFGVSTTWLLSRGPGVGEPVVSQGEMQGSVRRQVTFLGSATSPAFSPDGSRMAFLSRDSLGAAVLIGGTDPGSPIDTLLRARNLTQLRWMADATLLAYVRDPAVGRAGTYSISEATGAAAFVGPYPYYAPDPDGSRFAWTYTDYTRVVITRSDAEAQTEERSIEIGGPGEFMAGLQWSPQAPVVVVERTGVGGDRLRGVNVESGEQWEYAAAANLYSVQVSAAGDALFYVANGGDGSRLHELPLDPETGMPNGPAVSHQSTEESVAVSPDGRSLAYPNIFYESTVRWIDLDVDLAAAYARSRVLSRAASGRGGVAISPDGSTVALWDYGPDVLTILYPDGRAQEQLSLAVDQLEGAAASLLAWSPTGADLAAVVVSAGERSLVRLPMPGADRGVVLSSPVSMGLAWCGDGKLLVQDIGNRDYSMFTPNGARIGNVYGDRSQGWMFQPVCAPDGSSVAFNYNRVLNGSTPGLWTVDFETRRERLLVERDESGASVVPIGWAPGGDWIYFYRQGQLPFEVYRIRAEGGEPERVLTLPYATQQVTMSGDASKLVTVEGRSQSDIWMIENFRSEAGS